MRNETITSVEDFISVLNKGYSNNFTKLNLLIAAKKHNICNEVFGGNCLDKQIKIYHDLCCAENQIRVLNEAVPDINEIKLKILDTFPIGDVRRLIGLLYCWWPLRDDFQIVYLENIDNCLTINQDEALINKYQITIRKSKRIAAPLTRLVPLEIEKLIDNHVARHNVRPGDYLFGNSKKSWMVKRMMKKIGVNASINTFRRMHRKYALESRDEKIIIETARNSLHSIVTAPHYNSA